MSLSVAAQDDITTQAVIASNRVTSIDLLRGVVMIIMALDHVRDYFHADSLRFDPTDLSQSNLILFLTRWITHFCAPVFVFLAGTSAFLYGQRKTTKELSIFLLKRGLWLILLEVTIVSFAWSFNRNFNFTGLQVIWALGISMIALAALIHLPRRIIFIIGVIIVAGHNLLDAFHFDSFGWAALHEQKRFQVTDSHIIRVAYPVLPWIGIMALGYCFAKLYTTDFSTEKRTKWLWSAGIGVIALFIVLRGLNFYGDPNPWAVEASPTFTVLSFLNTEKYPPSLLYTAMTIGPSLIFLALMEEVNNRFTKKIIHIGRVPMFYYILHLYLIHALAMFGAEVSGFDWSDMVLHHRVRLDPQLKGYGFHLGVTYLVWIAVVISLYPLCKWYDKYKTSHREKWWLSYL